MNVMLGIPYIHTEQTENAEVFVSGEREKITLHQKKGVDKGEKSDFDVPREISLFFWPLKRRID